MHEESRDDLKLIRDAVHIGLSYPEWLSRSLEVIDGLCKCIRIRESDESHRDSSGGKVGHPDASEPRLEPEPRRTSRETQTKFTNSVS